MYSFAKEFKRMWKKEYEKRVKEYCKTLDFDVDTCKPKRKIKMLIM